jgi:hypothetical protein
MRSKTGWPGESPETNFLFPEDAMSQKNVEWEGLINTLADAYAQFSSACAALAPARVEQGGICGDWSARQVAAHLSGWNHEAARVSAQLLEDPDATMTNYDVDAFNAKSVTDRQGLSWAQTLDDLQAGFNEYKKIIAGVSEKDRATSAGFEEWLKIMTEEYQDHRTQLPGQS